MYKCPKCNQVTKHAIARCSAVVDFVYEDGCITNDVYDTWSDDDAITTYHCSSCDYEYDEPDDHFIDDNTAEAAKECEVANV